jgi:hypothetical protein
MPFTTEQVRERWRRHETPSGLYIAPPSLKGTPALLGLAHDTGKADGYEFNSSHLKTGKAGRAKRKARMRYSEHYQEHGRRLFKHSAWNESHTRK